MQIAVPLFPRVTALDAVGPYEVLQRPPGATVVFVGDAVGTIRTDGLTATTHWSARDALAGLGAVPTADRVVEHLPERIVTAAGVSSGIDMALRLSELLVDDVAARAMQLMVEYDPQPPFDAGSLDKAGPAVQARLAEYARTKW